MAFFTDPPTIGYDQGPKPMLSDHPVLGPLLQLALPLLGGMDSRGVPFLKLPSFQPDTRTATERAFAPNVADFNLVQRQVSQQMMSNVLTSFGVPHEFANSDMGRMFGQVIMGATGGGPFTWQDHTYGSVSSMIQNNSMRILASRSGFDTSKILDRQNSFNTAKDVAELYSATHRNIWGDNGVKNLGYTYGLTEKDIAPIVQSAFETHSQDDNLRRIRRTSDAYAEQNRNYSLVAEVGAKNTAAATEIYTGLQKTLGIDNLTAEGNLRQGSVSQVQQGVKNELEALKKALEANTKATDEEKDETKKRQLQEARKGMEFRYGVLSGVMSSDGTLNAEAVATAQRNLSDTVSGIGKLGDATVDQLRASRDAAAEEYGAARDTLRRSVAAQTQPWIRAKSLAKTVFGENADEVLRSIYGDDLYTDTTFADDAARKSAELVAMEKKYGISARQLGSVWKAAANSNGAAMGFSDAESSAGFGRYAAAASADSILFSTQAALDRDIQANPNMSGDEARRRAGEYAYGFSERYKYAESSEQFRLQTMLQHAKNTGALSNEQFNNLSSRLMSGDRKTRETAVSEFFNVAYGGYDQGAEIFNDQNRIKMMTAGMSYEDAAAIQDRLQQEATAEDTRDVKNAELSRRRANVMGTLNRAGLDGKKSQTAYTTGKREALERALRGSKASGASDILSAANDVYKKAIESNLGEDEARRRQLDYLERTVSSFVEDPEEANRILQAAEEGGVAGLERLSDENGEASGLGSRIQIAFRLGGLSQNEIDQLASARRALRNGDVQEAQRIYSGFRNSTGKRGELIEREFNRTQRSREQVEAQRKGSKALDNGGAATQSGMNFGAAAVMGAPGARKASKEISKVSEKVLNDTDQKAQEQEVDHVMTRLFGKVNGSGVGLMENIDSDPEERKNSPAVKGVQELSEAVYNGLKKWFGEDKGVFEQKGTGGVI